MGSLLGWTHAHLLSAQARSLLSLRAKEQPRRQQVPQDIFRRLKSALARGMWRFKCLLSQFNVDEPALNAFQGTVATSPTRDLTGSSYAEAFGCRAGSH